MPSPLRQGYTFGVDPAHAPLRLTRRSLLIAALLCAAHALTLTRVPFMHADEAWLASSTRAILEQGNPAATEGFFHITRRPTHAIRLLFHVLQLPFVAASWSLASVRLLALLCGLAVIALAAVVAARSLRTAAARWLFVGGLALDPQVVVSSHLARPEIVLVAAFMAALALRARHPEGGAGTAAAIGSVLGLSIGVHANSLVAALPIGALFVLDLLRGDGPRGRGRAAVDAAVFVATLAAWAALWVGLSRLLDPLFPRDYLEFGVRYGFGAGLATRLLRLPGFYGRLFEGIGGTYFVPAVRVPLLLFAASVAAAAALAVARALLRRPRPSRPAEAAVPGRPVAEALAMVVAVNLGFVAVGKYSQPSVVLLFAPAYLLAAALVDAGLRRIGARSTRRASSLVVAAVLAAIAASTAAEAVPWISVSYSAYLRRIREHVPAGARVLASVNTAFAFDPGRLYAFQDLDSLRSAGLSFAAYVERFRIGYIIYPEEMDRIYTERPIWNDLYGNVAPYYLQMRRFLRDRCDVIASYAEPVFAMRMTAYTGRGPYRLTIYRVRPSP